MSERKNRGDRSPQRRPAEGVRIIPADEAQAALDAGEAAGRRPDDELRFGDVPPAPQGPRLPHRFPLPDSVDPAVAVPRPPIAMHMRGDRRRGAAQPTGFRGLARAGVASRGAASLGRAAAGVRRRRTRLLGRPGGRAARGVGAAWWRLGNRGTHRRIGHPRTAPSRSTNWRPTSLSPPRGRDNRDRRRHRIAALDRSANWRGTAHPPG